MPFQTRSPKPARRSCPVVLPILLLALLDQLHPSQAIELADLFPCCWDYPKYVIYNQPNGCKLCNKHPLTPNSTYIVPITFQIYNNTIPPFANYSGWSTEEVGHLFNDEASAYNNPETGDPIYLTNMPANASNFPTFLRDRWAYNVWENISCACIAKLTRAHGDDTGPGYDQMMSYDCRRTEGYAGAIFPDQHCLDDEGTFNVLQVDQRPDSEGALFRPPSATPALPTSPASPITTTTNVPSPTDTSPLATSTMPMLGSAMSGDPMINTGPVSTNTVTISSDGGSSSSHSPNVPTGSSGGEVANSGGAGVGGADGGRTSQSSATKPSTASSFSSTSSPSPSRVSNLSGAGTTTTPVGARITSYMMAIMLVWAFGIA
ncbi:hypothetical protein HDV00_011629 [Rhizophlyctis rosea]|nr:hypothetical protein HDV00_011629 [Rhizophlyctis rosea]